jgi:type III secretion protein V
VRRGGDVVLPLLALAVVALLFAPLSPWLLDALLALNLALSATVLVVTLLAREALRFASFPTLLLFTTLFRLALEVSSTRLVLARGEAGRIIHALGAVVVQGNVVVGVVVFAILTLVQLLVVAKGAERVAEVAARFTLDAMPGKQMAIDADLRAGAIDQAEARGRRRALERESQLYGAMDGALKFVKGDAVAAVAIVAVNLAGGLCAGLARGLEPAAAARRYALLAIGDGLAAQVPALLLAVAAGVAVTRVAAEEEGGELGAEIGRQLFADPRALLPVAALCGALALAPGLPAPPFALLALAALAAAARLGRRAGNAQPSDAAAPGPWEPPAPVSLELASDLAELAGGCDGQFAAELLPWLREDLWRAMGVRLPPLLLRPAPLPPGRWRLLVDDVPCAAGTVPSHEALALAEPAEMELVAISCAPRRHPLTGAPAVVIPAAEASRAAAVAQVLDPLARLGLELASALRRSAAHLLSLQEAQALLDGLEPGHPALVREAARQVAPALLAEVLRRLLAEEVSIRPLPLILEALLDAGPGQDPGALGERCRRALRRHIAHRQADGRPLEAILLDPAAELTLREGLTGDAPSLTTREAARLLDALDEELGRTAGAKVVVLTGPEVRRGLRQVVALRHPRLAVLSYEELPPGLAVRPVGKLALPAA